MQSHVQLFKARSGFLSAKAVFADNYFRHIHSLVAPEAESDLYDSLEIFGDCIVFAGIGLGYHIERKIKSLPPTTTCIVLDYYPEFVANTRESLFASKPNPVFFCSSADSPSNRDALMAFVNTACLSRLQIIRHPASYDINKEFYDPLLDAISAAFCSSRKETAPALQPVLLCHGNFFLEEEVRAALATISVDPELFYYNHYGHGSHAERALMEAVQRCRPRCILSINMKGFDSEGILASVASRFSVPLAVWFVDDPRSILPAVGGTFVKNVTAFCWEKAYIPFLQAAGFRSVTYLPLAGNPAMKYEGPAVQYASKLGFVGTSMVDEFAGNIRRKFQWSDSLLPLVERIARSLVADPRYGVLESLDSVSSELDIRLPFADERNRMWLTAYIIHFASMKKRQAAIGALIPLGVETFGDPEGWRKLFGGAIHTHPNVDYRRELASVYRRILVNVNITSCQMPTTVNQRVFDIPLASSFVLTDRQPDIQELFDESEIATYGSTEELAEKTEFFINHQSERDSISNAAKAHILAEHTYEHRVKSILAAIP